MSLTGLLVAGALALGWNMGARSKSSGSRKTPSAVSSGSRGPVDERDEENEGTRLSVEDRQEIARLVRREVMAAQRSPDAAPKAGEVLPAQEPDAARREEMFTAALSTVQNARDVGTWTHEDGVVLQQVGASLTPEQRHEVVNTFLQAINSQKLTIEEGAFVP
jgi:hypothetical protein